MKKVTKIVTLAAAAMCAFAVVGGSFAVASANQKAYAAVNATYNITYKADSAITVKGPEVAKVGSKVTVELTYNHRLYEVVSVRVGNEYAAANNDNGKSFYFVMPDEDVDVVVNSRYLGAEEDVFDIRNYNGDKGLYLDGCPGNAKAGDIVIFSISMAADAPYRFGNVVELYTDDANQDDVDFVTDGYYYMFEMPAAPVLVFTLVEAKSYFLNFDQPDLINSVTYVDNVGFAGGSEVQCYDNDGDGYFIPYAADVVVEFRNSLMLKADGVKLGDQEVTFENTKKVKFVMPGKDLEMEVVNSPFYRPIAPDTEGVIDALFGVDDDFTNHYNFTFKRSSASNGEYADFDPAEALYGDYVRVYWTNKEGFEDRKLTNLKVYYIGEDGNPYTGNYLNTVSTSHGTDANGEYYQFTVGSSHYGFLVYAYDEAVLQFIGYEFVGAYKGYNIYSSGARSLVNCSYNATIDETGYFYHNTSAQVMIIKTEDTAKTGPGSCYVGTSATSTGKAFYGNGWFVRSYSGNTGAQNTYDLNVYFKSSDSVKYNYSLNRNNMCAVEAIVNNEVVGRLFYTLNGGITAIYTNPEFVFDNGTSVYNSTSFTVKVDGVAIGTVSGNGASASFTAA